MEKCVEERIERGFWKVLPKDTIKINKDVVLEIEASRTKFVRMIADMNLPRICDLQTWSGTKRVAFFLISGSFCTSHT